MLDYLYLFFSAFISATLFPLGSEGLLLYLVENGGVVIVLIAVASIANTLGSGVNYYFGSKGFEYLIQKKILTQKRADSSQKIFQKYGAFALLLSWVPIIGDPITLIAGAAKYNLKLFFFIVAFAKTSRYIFITILFLHFT